MSAPVDEEITRIRTELREADRRGVEELLPLIYDELRRLASGYLRNERSGHTLQTTALVHEAYLRLVGTQSDDVATEAAGGDTPADSSLETASHSQFGWQSRGHFFAAAAEAMRRILIDNARRKKRLKRGGDRDRLELEHVELAVPAPSVDLIALDEALV